MDCTFRKIIALLLFLESGMICKAQDSEAQENDGNINIR